MPACTHTQVIVLSVAARGVLVAGAAIPPMRVSVAHTQPCLLLCTATPRLTTIGSMPLSGTPMPAPQRRAAVLLLLLTGPLASLCGHTAGTCRLPPTASGVGTPAHRRRMRSCCCSPTACCMTRPTHRAAARGPGPVLYCTYRRTVGPGACIHSQPLVSIPSPHISAHAPLVTLTLSFTLANNAR